MTAHTWLRLGFLLVFISACSCSKDATIIKKAGAVCASDGACQSGLCDLGTCATAVGLLGKTCSEGASVAECGSYVCRSGKCRSCESDTECSTLGLGNRCAATGNGLKSCSNEVVSDTSDTTEGDTSDLSSEVDTARVLKPGSITIKATGLQQIKDTRTVFLAMIQAPEAASFCAIVEIADAKFSGTLKTFTSDPCSPGDVKVFPGGEYTITFAILPAKGRIPEKSVEVKVTVDGSIEVEAPAFSTWD